MFKKERVLCPVINKTRNTYFLFLITFFQTLFFMVSGPGHVSTLDKQWNCFPRAVLQTQHLLKHCRTCTCMRSHVLTYHSQEDNCNTKGQSIWFPLVHPRLYKQNTYIGQSSSITDYFRSPQQEQNCIYSVLVLATSHNPHVPLCARQNNY